MVIPTVRINGLSHVKTCHFWMNYLKILPTQGRGGVLNVEKCATALNNKHMKPFCCPLILQAIGAAGRRPVTQNLEKAATNFVLVFFPPYSPETPPASCTDPKQKKIKIKTGHSE